MLFRSSHWKSEGKRIKKILIKSTVKIFKNQIKVNTDGPNIDNEKIDFNRNDNNDNNRNDNNNDDGNNFNNNDKFYW